jgi:hypothetical protein
VARRVATGAVLMAVAGGALVLAPASPAAAAGCSPRTGPYQKQVEKYLGLRVDGWASLADCQAVQRFQQRFDIRPTAGYAGPLTYSIVRRFETANYRACSYSNVMRVCVDLTSQTMWVTKQGKRIYGPAPVRTGKRGYATPTGVYRISDKKLMTTSSIYNVKMPYWQRVYRGVGFHQAVTWMYDPKIPGSHGCLNLAPADARGLYNITARGTWVQIFGRKPGT